MAGAVGRGSRGRAAAAALFCAILLGLNACASQPLLSVGTQSVTAEPNAEAAGRESDVPYAIGQPATLSVTLVRPDGQRQELVSQANRSPDQYAFPFSGVVDVPNSADRKVLPDGTYQLIFQARGSGGQQARQAVTATVKDADPVPLTLDNLTLSLPSFSPNGQGVRQVPGAPVGQFEDLDKTTLDFRVSKSADIFIWVTDGQGKNTALESLKAHDVKAGEQKFEWNGRDAEGAALPDGSYTIHVRASDASGNLAEKTVPVTLFDSGTPHVQIVDAKFWPTALGFNGVVNVQVTVKNSGTVPIKTLGPPPGTAYTTHMSYLDPSFNKPGDIFPPYVDTPGRWRVAVHWTSGPPNYPARWGFFADDNRALQPQQQVTVNGSIRILAPQPPNINFWAAVEMGGIGFTKDYGQTNVVIGFPTQG